jgi:hypothetical protein
MREEKALSEDQLKRIAETLERIQRGLSRFQPSMPRDCEPAHIFKPEAFDDQQS